MCAAHCIIRQSGVTRAYQSCQTKDIIHPVSFDFPVNAYRYVHTITTVCGYSLMLETTGIPHSHQMRFELFSFAARCTRIA